MLLQAALRSATRHRDGLLAQWGGLLSAAWSSLDRAARRVSLPKDPSGPSGLKLDTVSTFLGIERVDLADVKASPDREHVLIVSEEPHALLQVHVASDTVQQWDTKQQRVGGVTWVSDTVFAYTVLDDKLRPYQVVLVRDGEHKEVFREDDPRFFLFLSRSKDGSLVTIQCVSKTSTEIHRLEPDGSTHCLFQRQPQVQCYVEHVGNNIYQLHNTSGEGFQVDRLLDDGTAAAVAPPYNVEDGDFMSSGIVLYERDPGTALPRLRLLPHNGNHTSIPLPSGYMQCSPGLNADPHASSVHMTLSSPVLPPCSYHLDLASAQLIAAEELQGPEGYRADRVEVPSGDVQVPMTVIARRDVQRCAPMLMVGYGAYGTCLEAGFDPTLFPLLDAGWRVVLAHVRGGGERGAQWHQQGKLQNKGNSFRDVVACAAYCIERGWTSSRTLAGMGQSAGGLLMAAVANQHPHLFHSLVLRMPFLNVLHTMLDPSLPLTEHEVDEWGDPADSSVYTTIAAYDPLFNLKAEGPHVWVSCSLQDTRVPYQQAVDYVDRIRELKRDRLVVLDIDTEHDHFGDEGAIRGVCRDNAAETAFLRHTVEAASHT